MWYIGDAFIAMVLFLDTSLPKTLCQYLAMIGLPPNAFLACSSAAPTEEMGHMATAHLYNPESDDVIPHNAE